MGGIHAAAGEWEAGIDACQHALERAPDPLSTAQASGWLGYAHLEMQNPTKAVPLLEQAVRQLSQFRFRQLEGWFTAWLSEALLLSGQIEKALQLASQGVEIARHVGDGYGVGLAQRALGRIYQASGALSQAETHLKGALDTFTSIQARFEAGRTHLSLAEVAYAQGNQAGVTTSLREAQELFRALRVWKYVARTEELARGFGAPPFEQTAGPGQT
jgi:tetratricopeptide (TPR) repeat protein